MNVKKINDFYLQISALYCDKLNIVSDTIIFLDEIQVYPHLLTLLKPLKQDNKFRYIASGSLLRITMKHTFIPMGSIEEVKMYPMDFEEFFLANHFDKSVIAFLRDCFNNLKPIPEGLHKTVIEKFKEYLICGGLPDFIKAMIEEKNVLINV